MKLGINTKKAGIVALIAVGIDFIFHFFFTSPMESFQYFVVKALVVFVVAFFMFKKSVDLKRALTFSTIFVIIFGVYYRLTEVVEGNGWLSRVPDIHLGTFSVTSADPLMAGLVWGLFHGSFFLIGWYISQRY